MSKRKNKKVSRKHRFIHEAQAPQKPKESIDVDEKVATKEVETDKRLAYIKKDLKTFTFISATIITVIVILYVLSIRTNYLNEIIEKINF